MKMSKRKYKQQFLILYNYHKIHYFVNSIIQMLIKDPYLQSHKKQIDIRSQPPIIQVNTTTTSQPVYSELPRHRASSAIEVNQMQAKVRAYQKELKNMQEEAARKMMNFQNVNREYHEAMRLRNLDLNTKLNNAVCQMQLAHHRSQEDYMRYTHDKDVLFTKYQEQAEELLRLRSSFNSLLQQKTRIEEELNNVTFLIEKQRHQNELQIKQFAFRMESMDRTYKGLVVAKDEEISQLINRLRIYQEQNRKLNDINKTLQLTRDRNDKIDNLSQIHHLQSNIKSNIKEKEKDKENQDHNAPRSHFKQNNQLKQQRNINEELRRQLENIKKQLGEISKRNNQLESEAREAKEANKLKSIGEGTLIQTSKWQGFIASISTLREGINKEIFQIFFKSIKDGEKKKQNSLVIFIQNWKCLEMERLEPYIRSYFENRNALKEIASTQKAKESPHYSKILETIPLKVGSKPGRSNINQWILSTIQFTKNQKEAGKKSLNNFLLFLFRLLTIQYRVRYPMQGKSYHLDADVRNQLQHQTIKAIELIFKYQ